MKHVIRLIDILDDSTVNKLITLDRLVRVYVKFLNKWRVAEVTSNGTIVRVKFTYIDKHGYETWTEREFLMEDIDKRISTYKRKLKKLYIERHHNERIRHDIDMYHEKKNQ